MAARLSLDVLQKLAIEWCPKKARWPHLLESADTWGPAHEIGHALIEPRSKWNKEGYGHCALGFCQCEEADTCTVYEAAAMIVSGRLLVATGNAFMAEREVNDTTDYDYIESRHFKQAKALLRKKKLWPVPRTRKSLEAALKRRLVKPRGGPLGGKKPKKAGAILPLLMFAEMLAGL